MAGLGLPAKVVQERLGHSSITVTLDTYGHLFPRGDDSAIRRNLGPALRRHELRVIEFCIIHRLGNAERRWPGQARPWPDGVMPSATAWNGVAPRVPRRQLDAKP